ncbi:MAG TPA: hypothetical protein VG733_20335 [Chthoniobacteraceae bacterium]|nr:hypothetical protein [Chthoniobacteraceae bacterium]
MKLTPICISLFLGATTLMAQQPSTVHNLTLDVENQGAGGASKSTNGTTQNNNNNNNNNTTYTTTSSQTHNHATTLGVTIRSLDKVQDQVKVEWWFFGRKMQNYRPGKETVFDSGTKEVTLAPTGSSVFTITSKVAQTTRSTQTTTTNNNNNNNRNGRNTNNNVTTNTTETQSGTEISGWVVRIWVDGKIYEAKGSEFKYEDAAKDPDKFAQLKAGKEVQW